MHAHRGPTVASSTLFLKTLFDYDACTYWVLITDLVRVWWATGDRALLERDHRRLNANMMPADAILRNLATWLTRPTGVERAAQVEVCMSGLLFHTCCSEFVVEWSDEVTLFDLESLGLHSN